MRIFLLILLTMSAKYAIAQNDYALKGTWAVDVNATLQDIDTKAKPNYSKIPQRIRDQAKNSFASRTYQFHDRNEIIIDFDVSNGHRTVAGIWTYQRTILQITLKERTKEYKVKWLGKDRICLIDEHASNANLIKSIFLTRKN